MPELDGVLEAIFPVVGVTDDGSEASDVSSALLDAQCLRLDPGWLPDPRPPPPV